MAPVSSSGVRPGPEKDKGLTRSFRSMMSKFVEFRQKRSKRSIPPMMQSMQVESIHDQLRNVHRIQSLFLHIAGMLLVLYGMDK